MGKEDMYKAIKEELSRQCNTKYFTKKFFLMFIRAEQSASYNARHGIDDSYRDPECEHIVLRHSFDGVYASDFYIKNSSAYCTFLELYQNCKVR